MDTESGRYANTATGTDRGAVARRVSTETKASYKTTEFAVYVVVFVGILLASLLVKTGQDGQRVDYFRADKAWWYITLLTIGYMTPAAGQVRQPRALRRPPLAVAGRRPTSGCGRSHACGSRTRRCGVRRPRIKRSPP